MIDWRHWHNEPYLVGGLIVLGWLYALLTGPFRHRLAPGAPYPRAHAIKFYTALVIFYLAVGSPLDQIGERFLLSAHMIQHMLLIYGSAILFLLGLPHWLVSPVTARPVLRLPLRILFHPIICAILYTLTISIWHAPALYDWALQSKLVHVLEHVMFFAAALLYWWPVLSPSREFPPLGYGLQMIYLLAVTIGMTPLFAFLAFADNVLYPTYEYAPRIIENFSPAQDQLLGASIMKLGGLFITLIALIIAFYRWYQESEARALKAPAPSARS
jgi:putative membrane protein